MASGNNREHRRAYQREWWQKHREHVNAERRNERHHKLASYEVRLLTFTAKLDATPDVHLAYVAGLVDGEGSIVLHRVSGVRPHFSAMVVVANTDAGMLQWLHDTLGGYVHWAKGWENACNAKLLGRWSVNGRCAAELCRRIIPYLRTPKRRRAEFVLDFFVKGFANIPGQRLDDDERQRREVLFTNYERECRGRY